MIELASAGVLIWRLSVELKHGRAFAVALGLLAQLVIGAWWVDSVTSLAIPLVPDQGRP